MERVAVVGGAGFLGSHMVDYLVELGRRVVVVDNLEVGRREFVHKEAEFVHADITQSENFLRRVFQGCSAVYNYAARPYVPDSYERPLRTFEVNCMGAVQVINAAWEADVPRILQVSSAEVYGTPSSSAIPETAPVAALSSYGASKAAIDMYCQVAWQERSVPVIALRQFNCIGERETHPYVLPEIVSQLWKQRSSRNAVVELGNNSERDFMPARDAVRSAVRILEKGRLGGVYNLGSGSCIKVYDLAATVAQQMDFRSVAVKKDTARERRVELWYLRADCSRAEADAGPLPRTPLSDAIARAIAWFDDNGGRWPWER